MHQEPEQLTRWLDQLKQAPSEAAIASLDEAIEQLAESGLPPGQLARLLECIRVKLPDEIERVGKAWYADRPLPLAPERRAVLAAVQNLFGKLVDAFLLCCQQFEREPASPERTIQTGATLQRCVHALLYRMIEDYRARQAIEPGVWRSLHSLMDKAQALGVSTQAVADTLNPVGQSTLNSTYGRAVLLASAQAGAMTPRNLDATIALTGLLESFIDCSWQAGDVQAEQKLESTGRLRVLRAAGAVHLLNNARLGGALNACSAKLLGGDQIASLDVLAISRSDLAGLLARLHRVWCASGEIRATPREPANERASGASGAYDIFRMASGSEFVVPAVFLAAGAEDARLKPAVAAGTPAAQPGVAAASAATSAASASDAAVIDGLDPGVHGAAPTAWRILDRSGEGWRAARRSEGVRVMRGSLMGFRITSVINPVAAPGAALEHFSLGEVRWVQEDLNAGLWCISAGFKLLPGKVVPAVMRGQTLRDGATVWQAVPVFLIEHTASPKLVVPNGWWQAQRVVEVWRNNAVTRLVMGEVVISGADFDAGRYRVEAAR